MDQVLIGESAAKGDWEAIDLLEMEQIRYLFLDFNFHKIFKTKVTQVPRDPNNQVKLKNISPMIFTIVHLGD